MRRFPRSGPTRLLVRPAVVLGAFLAGLYCPASASAVTPAAAGCPSPGGVAMGEAPAPAGAQLVVRGHGWGHSTGMSQYGAQGAARLGCSYRQILSTYYRGTSVSTRSLAGAVDVVLMTGGTSARVTAVTASAPWRGPAGKAATQPVGSTWTVLLRGRSAFLRDAAGHNVLSVSDGQTLSAVQDGRVARVRSRDGASVVTDRRLRWGRTRFMPSAAGLSATQAIRGGATASAVQRYLWGLAEVPSSWPVQALRAQAVAARTYLARHYRADHRAYVVSATPSDQNYGGYAFEADDAASGGRWRAAVEATRGAVVVDRGGRPIEALYTSSHGGRSEDVRYSFGGSATGYLVPVNDGRWDRASDNPYGSWAAGFTATDLARRFGLDSLTSITVARPGSSARLTGVHVAGRLRGARVTRKYSGMAARSLLGVRSPGFTFAWVRRPVVDNGVAVSGDWDGDGRTDVGWFADGTFTLRRPDGTRRRIVLGRAGDVPVIGDWNGDGRDGIGVFRDGAWSVRNSLSGTGAVGTFRFGRPGDRPVTGRWTAASPVGIGVVRGSRWLLRGSPTAGVAELSTLWPGAGRPLLGDWTGSGRAVPAWVDGGRWTLSRSVGAPQAWKRLTFGRTGDDYLAGDWSGPTTGGRQTPAVARSSSFYWRTDLRGGPPSRSLVFAP
jgi:stage II sporulation protein D